MSKRKYHPFSVIADFWFYHFFEILHSFLLKMMLSTNRSNQRNNTVIIIKKKGSAVLIYQMKYCSEKKNNFIKSCRFYAKLISELSTCVLLYLSLKYVNSYEAVTFYRAIIMIFSFRTVKVFV